MPTFQFTSPEGKSYSVQGPGGSTPEQAFQILQTQIGGGAAPAAAAPGSSAVGVAKSLGAGLAEGAIGMAGLPGDLYHIGLRALGDNLTPESNYGSHAIQQAVESKTGEFYKPQGAAEDIANKIGQFAPAVIGGPESLATKVATRVVAPAMASEAGGAVGGPLGEVAGALAGGAGASMALRKGSALIAARGAAEVPTVDEIKAAARAQYQHPDVQAVQIKPEALARLADTIENDLRHGQNSGFRPANEPKVFGAVDELRTPAETQVAADTGAPTLSVARKMPDGSVRIGKPGQIHSDLMSRAELATESDSPDVAASMGFANPQGKFLTRQEALDFANRNEPSRAAWSAQQPQYGLDAATYNEATQPRNALPMGGRPATVADLDNVRQVLGNAAKERDVTGSLTRQAVAANRAIDHIDNFLPSLQQGDLLAGDAAKANDILETARQNWGAAKRAEQVQTIAKNAEINAASANSGGNLQNATKQAFKPLLKNNEAKAGGYTAIEKQALNKIVRGTWTGTAARAAGNLLGGGGGLGMLAGGAAGYEEGGVPGAIAVGLAGRGLKKIGTNSTLGAVRHLDELLRSRAPEALKVAAQNPKIVQLLPSNSVKALRAMILAEPGLAQISNGAPNNSNQQSGRVGQGTS